MRCVKRTQACLVVWFLADRHFRRCLEARLKGSENPQFGGDHHYADGLVYGLADVWPTKIENRIRVTDPGCFPALIEIALAHHW